jgi:hypothetical protein
MVGTLDREENLWAITSEHGADEFKLCLRYETNKPCASGVGW